MYHMDLFLGRDVTGLSTDAPLCAYRMCALRQQDWGRRCECDSGCAQGEFDSAERGLEMYARRVQCMRSVGSPVPGLLTDALLCVRCCLQLDNSIGSSGARAMADALMVNSALKSVNLSGTHSAVTVSTWLTYGGSSCVAY